MQLADEPAHAVDRPLPGRPAIPAEPDDEGEEHRHGDEREADQVPVALLEPGEPRAARGGAGDDEPAACASAGACGGTRYGSHGPGPFDAPRGAPSRPAGVESARARPDRTDVRELLDPALIDALAAGFVARQRGPHVGAAARRGVRPGGSAARRDAGHLPGRSAPARHPVPANPAIRYRFTRR